MNKVVVYPGRFQPMLSHHAQVYQQLQAQFPDAEVYIGTSDKVDGDKSPFDFQEKKLIAQAHGIDPSKVLQVRSPYNAAGYDFDPENTVLIFAVGEKDLDRFPFNNIDPGTGLDMTVRGEPKPKYLQKLDSLDQGALPMSKRGYVTLAPTIKTGDAVASASAFRQQLKDAPDVESAKQVYTTQFGEYNDKIFDLIYNKIVGTNNMSEQLNYMRKLAGLQVEEGAPVNMAPGYAMTDTDRKLAEIGRLIMDMANQRPMGKGTPESELGFQNMLSDFGGRLADGSISDSKSLIDYIKDAGEHAAELSDAVKQAMADYAAGKKADVKGEEPAEEPEAEDEFEGVDLSDFYSDQEEVTEGAGDLNELLGRFERECVEDYRYYGDVDAAKVQQHLDRGDMEGAAEEMAGAMTDQDGGSDNFDAIYDVAKDMIDDHMHTAEAIEDQVCPECDGSGCEACDDVGGDLEEADKPDFLDLDKDGDKEESMKDAAEDAEEEVGSHPCHVCGNMSYADGACSDRTCSNFDQPVEIDETVEAVESTSHNAMQAAMAELRKLAGI